MDKELKILDELTDYIDSNRRRAGEKLPSENELAQRYGVPRMKARSALTKLEERGYIYSQQGKGRYIKQAPRRINLHLTAKTSFTEKMQEAGCCLETENLGCQLVAYDEQIYRSLGIEPETRVFQISRLRYVDGDPLAIHSSFVSEAMFPDIQRDGPQISSMFAYYRQKGFRQFAGRGTLLSTKFPTAEENQRLRCGSMVPLIMVEGDCIDAASGHVLEHTKVLYRSDTFKYDITMD